MKAAFINILSAIIVFQLAFLIVFLFSSTRGKRLSNRILALFFLWLLFNLADGLLTYSGFYEQFPSLAHLEDGFIFVAGPLLYFYTQSIVYRDFSFRKSDLLHFLPFALVTLSYQIFYHLQPEDYQRLIQHAIARQELPAAFYLIIPLIYLHVSTYMFFAFREIRIYREKIKDRFSSLTRINLDWLAFVLLFVVVIFVVSMVYTFLPATGLREWFDATIIMPFVFIFVFINAVVWKGLKQPEIFSGIEFRPEGEERKYAGSPLTELETSQVRTKVQHLFKEEKVFLQPEISIDQLAAAVNTSPKKLSQVINESFHQNFFDFVNTYRIGEAKKILQESTDTGLTVLEVMYQCGFNSKSSFNTIFRKKTGITPSEFRKQALSGKQL